MQDKWGAGKMSSDRLNEVRPLADLKDMIGQSTELFGEKDAFLVKDKSGAYEGISFLQLKQDMDALGTALADMGLKDGFVAVVGENRYEWCVTYLAVVNGVGVIVPIDKELPMAETVGLLQRCNAAAVVYSGKFAAEMKKRSAELPTVRYFICMDGDMEDERFLSYSAVVQKGRRLLDQGDTRYTGAVIDREKMSVLLFTSGTTGHAKGVMLSHKNICTVITSVCASIQVDSSDSSLSILPLHHTYECSLGFLSVLYIGGTIAFNEGLKQIGKNLKEARPTLLIAVPLILEGMYKKIWEQAAKKKGAVLKLKFALFLADFLHRVLGIDIRRKLFKPIHDNLGGRVRLIITGAAAIDPEVSKGFRHMGIHVLQGYGLTECAPLVTGNRDHAFIDSSAGLPIPGVEVRIEDPDELGVGEIIVRGDNVMLGYFEDREATEKCMKNGWFHTGDLGKFDKKGFLFITGRSKNVIVTKNGKNIYPEELEATINKNPYVLESLVSGIFDEGSGETLIHAQILPNLDAIREKLKGISISAEDISKVISEVVKSVNKDMPLYKRIRNFSVRDSEFVKTTTKKIKRHLER